MPPRRAPKRSAALTEGPHVRRPGMLKAAGFSDEDLARPLIAWPHLTEIGPATTTSGPRGRREGGHRERADALEFNTVSISDGITMGRPA